MRQINRKNCPKFILAVHARVPYKHETRRRIGQLKCLWTKEREAGVWDFKGRAGNLQVDEKEQTRDKQILAGPPRNNGTQREVPQRGLSRFPHLPLLVYFRIL